MASATIPNLASALFPAVHAAGREIMRHYDEGFDVRHKADGSPVTVADQAAEDILVAALAQIAPDVPVIAEESAAAGVIPPVAGRFFLVDPLDGTKEFAARRPEFTVNVALIENGTPRFGIIYAPAMSQIYWSGETCSFGAQVPPGQFTEFESLTRTELRTRNNTGPLTIVASRSHGSDELETWLKSVRAGERTNIGSSLKFCLVAEGKADLYPRFGPTREWDTAAGHAISAAAGGVVTTLDGSPLLYGKADAGYLNPYFIVWARPQMLEAFKS